MKNEHVVEPRLHGRGKKPKRRQSQRLKRLPRKKPSPRKLKRQLSLKRKNQQRNPLRSLKRKNQQRNPLRSLKRRKNRFLLHFSMDFKPLSELFDFSPCLGLGPYFPKSHWRVYSNPVYTNRGTHLSKAPRFHFGRFPCFCIH